MGAKYPLHIYYHGIKNLKHLFENVCLRTLERGEALVSIVLAVLCEEIPSDLTMCFTPFFSQLPSKYEIFIKLYIPVFPVLVKRQEESQNNYMNRTIFESFESLKHSWCLL